jgi:hypothetical protein
MGLFDEPIMIDIKDVSYKPPKDAKLLDLEKLCLWPFVPLEELESL